MEAMPVPDSILQDCFAEDSNFSCDSIEQQQLDSSAKIVHPSGAPARERLGTNVNQDSVQAKLRKAPLDPDQHSDCETATVPSSKSVCSDIHNDLEVVELVQKDEPKEVPGKSSSATGRLHRFDSAKEMDDVTIPCLLCAFKTTLTSLLHTHIVTSHKDIFVIKVSGFIQPNILYYLQ